VARLVSARQAARGARVVVADLQSERRAELAEEIGGAFISVDVTNTEQIEAAVNSPSYGQGERSEAFKAKLGKSLPFPHRLGGPDELASMVVELVTNSYMNAEGRPLTASLLGRQHCYVV
jgi:hypothetical protein